MGLLIDYQMEWISEESFVGLELFKIDHISTMPILWSIKMLLGVFANALPQQEGKFVYMMLIMLLQLFSAIYKCNLIKWADFVFQKNPIIEGLF